MRPREVRPQEKSRQSLVDAQAVDQYWWRGTFAPPGLPQLLFMPKGLVWMKGGGWEFAESQVCALPVAIRGNHPTPSLLM